MMEKQTESIPAKYIIVYSDRHATYGLFDDLKDRKDVQLIEIKPKRIRNRIAKMLRRVHLSRTIATRIHLPLRHLWYSAPQITIEEGYEYYLVMVDIVLFSVSLASVKNMLQNNNVKSILLMINSMKTDAIKQVEKEMWSIDWDSVFTYDEMDAEQYGFNSAGYSYYSMHDKNSLDIHLKKKTDAYFIGTMKATRKKTILSLFDFLIKNGLKPEFHLLKTVNERYEDLPYKDEIDYFTSDKGLIPYEEILSSVIKTNLIIEILQEGQTGPSLRYYEAVCYNKKLLTNNPYIHTFPLYDERYMKVFESIDDIDIEWICEEMDVNYHYNNEFSPVHLLDRISG